MGVQIQIKPTKELLKDRGLQRGGAVQKYVDSTVVRYSDKYCPKQEGELKRAIGTIYGSGYVRYDVPYAKRHYYKNTGSGLEGTKSGGLRGRKWFERMKAVYGEVILNNAAKISKAKARKK